jgi:hypothetical protein
LVAIEAKPSKERFWSGAIKTKAHAEKICCYVGSGFFVLGLGGAASEILNGLHHNGISALVSASSTTLLFCLPGFFLWKRYSLNGARMLLAVCVLSVALSYGGYDCCCGPCDRFHTARHHMDVHSCRDH